MASDVIGRNCVAQFVGVGKVRDHRLAFSRRSVSRRGGAADIVAEDDMVTWGVLYEISDEDMSVLDRKEGHPRAYRRVEVDVEVRGVKGVARRCVTYSVVDKVSPEIAPQPDYLADLVRGAEEWKLPSSYRTFLASLAAEPRDEFRQHGYLILPTKRVDRRPLGVLQVSRTEKRSLGLGDLAVVQVGKRRCVVCVLIDDGLDAEQDRLDRSGRCRLDQNVRDALGVPGQWTYGATALLHPCADRTSPWSFIQPRFLVLPVTAPARLDSEKNIAVLHHKNIGLLGLHEGDYVRLRTAVKDANDRHVTRSITIRTFAGSIRDWQTLPASETEYPKLTQIYVDADGRRALGLGEKERGAPVVVTADIRKMFLSRALFYGLTYFVGIAGLAATTGVLLDWLRGVDSSAALVYLISAVIAGLLTATLAVVDIRSRVQY
jgi:hypothetical protein